MSKAWHALARDAIERHLGDVCSGDDEPATIFEEANTLALDALHDAGVPPGQAAPIAYECALAVSGAVEDDNVGRHTAGDTCH